MSDSDIFFLSFGYFISIVPLTVKIVPLTVKIVPVDDKKVPLDDKIHSCTRAECTSVECTSARVHECRVHECTRAPKPPTSAIPVHNDAGSRPPDQQERLIDC